MQASISMTMGMDELNTSVAGGVELDSEGCSLIIKRQPEMAGLFAAIA